MFVDVRQSPAPDVQSRSTSGPSREQALEKKTSRVKGPSRKTPRLRWAQAAVGLSVLDKKEWYVWA